MVDGMNKRLRQRWTQAGYPATMGSAEVVPPPATPEFLRLYHLTAMKHGLSDLTHQRLKVARFADLNDPFELLALNFKEKSIRTAVREFRASYNSKNGLLCFSSDWTNPVLWSHYAERHTGICLGFDVPRAHVQKVDYADKRILAALDDDVVPFELSDTHKQLLLRTKFSHWEYETEYRIFVPLSKATREGSFFFRPFGPDLTLKEIILGPQCALHPEDVRKQFKTLSQSTMTIKARLAFKFFKVVPDERTVP